MMQKLGDEMLDSIPYADEITSLVDMEISIGTEEGIELINPFENGVPTEKAELERIKKLVLSRQALKGKIVSADCTETWLTLSLLAFPEEEVWRETSTQDPLFETGEVALRVLTNPKWQSDNIH